MLLVSNVSTLTDSHSNKSDIHSSAVLWWSSLIRSSLWKKSAHTLFFMGPKYHFKSPCWSLTRMWLSPCILISAAHTECNRRRREPTNVRRHLAAPSAPLFATSNAAAGVWWGSSSGRWARAVVSKVWACCSCVHESTHPCVTYSMK